MNSTRTCTKSMPCCWKIKKPQNLHGYSLKIMWGKMLEKTTCSTLSINKNNKLHHGFESDHQHSLCEIAITFIVFVSLKATKIFSGLFDKLFFEQAFEVRIGCHGDDIKCQSTASNHRQRIKSLLYILNGITL